MADKLHFDLVSPERRVFAGQVDQVVVPGEEGDFGVLPDHAPFMSVIRPGAIAVMNDGSVERTFIHGGFAEVTPAGLTILAEEAVPVSEIDADKLAQDLANAREDVAVAKSEEEREHAEGLVEKYEAMQAVLAN
ncbi:MULTISPECIES: F0F1 ATP synthase subunit epsilon [Maricaulis]|uniref:ATP synthase epsilon chain n=1 Tax=Maricaulis virginensis TaxID=144022 RepID=A0A9W6IMZ1_9PROT|nr:MULTISPECIES: F0F1 ATP synthase subunit epsilon [Maricaulis]MAC38604.1 F0F1 ATP synthase subunit epsilon [Oceanicaulis sp.]MBO6766616.1 F0F1 ATP synthase subunit epsilon [Maricaulis sp.]GLK53312.1 ATP synthase epsilon chain [Maricaulis virginensis]|tara:strand:+ start:409 stop:810 length:402 start_codon:yes stop_codon:yes gene_type:complete